MLEFLEMIWIVNRARCRPTYRRGLRGAISDRSMVLSICASPRIGPRVMSGLPRFLCMTVVALPAAYYRLQRPKLQQ